MTEYIERGAPLREAKYAAVRGLDPVAFVEDVPVADVALVVHGQWIPFHSDVAGDIQYCSACEIGFGAKMDYCPHCGAKMDGGE